MRCVVAYHWHEGDTRLPHMAPTGVALVDAERTFATVYPSGTREALYHKSYPGKGPADAGEKFLQLHSPSARPRATVLGIGTFGDGYSVQLVPPIEYAAGGCSMFDAHPVIRGRGQGSTPKMFGIVGLDRYSGGIVNYRIRARTLRAAFRDELTRIANGDLRIWCVIEHSKRGQIINVPTGGPANLDPDPARDPASLQHWEDGQYEPAWWF